MSNRPSGLPQEDTTLKSGIISDSKPLIKKITKEISALKRDLRALELSGLLDIDTTEQSPAEACSFCRKVQKDCGVIVVGNGVSICDACIKICNQILEESPLKTPE